MQDENSIPRWQQGPRPGAYGPTWDAMSPKARRAAFIGDLILEFGGAGLMYLFAWLAGGR